MVAIYQQLASHLDQESCFGIRLVSRQNLERILIAKLVAVGTVTHTDIVNPDGCNKVNYFFTVVGVGSISQVTCINHLGLYVRYRTDCA